MQDGQTYIPLPGRTLYFDVRVYVCVLRRGGGLCVLSILPGEWYIHTHVYIQISHVGYTYTHIYHPIGMTHTFIQPSS